MKQKSELLKIIGFIILSISCILFILIPVAPWFNFSAGQIAGITAGLLIAGEILFYLSLIILGRSFFDKIKNKLKFWKSKTNGSNLSAENE
ncbi:MAG TPA: transporter suffix domain-containing protein [Anaerovoracaceae bacterium]|nr:transporter suffix domain-containing protein [Anaerovoracaceae bacterium]